MQALSLSAVQGLPEIVPGDDLAELICRHSQPRQRPPGAVLVIAQKVVSKSEDRFVSLADVSPGGSARALAEEVGKDPRLVELILSESRAVIRKRPGLLVVEHRTGHILANAGIDASNIAQDTENPRVLLWPTDPDASARAIATALDALLEQPVPVIINDSIGRAWRLGTTGHAIGCHGLEPLWDLRGERDRFGNVLRVTLPATADAIAAAAALLQGEAAESLPAVWLTGCSYRSTSHAAATQLLRPADEDLFR